MTSIRCSTAAILLATTLVNSGWAQGYSARPLGGTYGGWQASSVRQAGGAGVIPEAAGGGPVSMGQYPQLNAPMYPAPVQNTPPWTGGTVITNQALAPHEMLYPHDYHAMYPPFFHKVKGAWIVTPFGVRSHEQWKLQGTEVKVKYRSSIPLLSGYVPPRHHY